MRPAIKQEDDVELQVQRAQPVAASADEILLETELVQLALRAAEHHPILKAVYVGPQSWLEDARLAPGDPGELASSAQELAARAESAGQPYAAGQARSVAVQLGVKLGRVLPYDQMVAALLGVKLDIPPRDEILALQADVLELAARLEPGSGSDPIRRWEERRLIKGEDKWEVAMVTYLAGRRYARASSFPIKVAENLEIIRITDELWSINLSWYPPARMTFEVNVDAPRTQEGVAFEVAHNIYPGDYLHLAVLHQFTYGRLGHVTASIKLKNAPESVVSEGIEETALLRMTSEPTDAQILATKLEWLRRLATFSGAIALHLDGRPDDAVIASMAADGYMDEQRARFQLGYVKHPLWGPYQYTYILGRKLVQEADRRSIGKDQRAYLEYLYGGLHTPQTFLANLP